MGPEDGSGRADPAGAPGEDGPDAPGPSLGSGSPGAATTVPARPGPPDRLAERPLDQPHPDRLPTDRRAAEAVIVVHRAALEAGLSGYVDPSTGLFVLTASSLAARGVCCEKGCRHCPYLV